MLALRIDNRFLVHDLRETFQSRNTPGLNDLAHVTAWESYDLHDLGHVFLGLIRIINILHNIS